MQSRPWWDWLLRFRLELILAAVVVLSVGAVWQSIVRHDRTHVYRITMLAASGIQADFESDLRERVEGQVRLAQLWNLAGRPTQQDWESSAQLYMGHNQGSLMIEWIDPSYQDRWVFPRSAHATDDAMHAAAPDERRQVLERSLQQRRPAVSRMITLPTGERLLLAAVPVFHQDRLAGFILNTMDVHASFAAMLQDVSNLGYDFAILQGSTHVYSPRVGYENLPHGMQYAELPLPSMGWTVRVWPQSSLQEEMKSHLAEMLVGTMAALGLVAIITVRLAKVARRQTALARAARNDMEREVLERRRMEEAAHVSEARFAGILDISADAIISSDSNQRIVLFNQGAEELFGYRAEEVLGQPLDLLLPQSARASHRHHVAQFAAQDTVTMRMCNRRSVAGRRKDGTEFPAEATVSKLVVNGAVTFTAILRDITQRVETEALLRRSHEELELRVQQRTTELATVNVSLRELSGRLLASQEEERRRIARELHDSTASTLVLALINLDKVQKCDGPASEPGMELLRDGMRQVEHAISELRTVSYRLHPPMLEEFGLSFALTWYINGFSERSGIHIDVTVDPDLARLSPEVELTMFRIVQEALANVHRHAQAASASVVVRRESDAVRLEVADTGKGMGETMLAQEHAAPVLGVGIAGMRERVRQVGGTFEIKSGPDGTIVTAVFPISDTQSATAAASHGLSGQ